MDMLRSVERWPSLMTLARDLRTTVENKTNYLLTCLLGHNGSHIKYKKNYKFNKLYTMHNVRLYSEYIIKQ